MCYFFIDKKYLITIFKKSGFVDADFMRMQGLDEEYLKKTKTQILLLEKAEAMK